jgi:hypothetical protein
MYYIYIYGGACVWLFVVLRFTLVVRLLCAYIVVVLWCGVRLWSGVVWCAWCNEWCGVVWCGVVWCGVVWCGVV